MTAPDCNCNRLVADIGGTNTRLALFDPAANEFRALCTFVNREHAQFEDIIAIWLDSLGEPAPTACCLAVAAPPFDDRVTMSNMDWSFSCRELAGRFNFAQLRCINDFAANAYALPHLGAEDRTILHAGQAGTTGKLATVGPGTGLGGSTLEIVQGIPIAGTCEPGHMGLTPATELELDVFRLLLPRHGEVHTELLVSGPGLQRLYQALAQIHDDEVEQLTPGEITNRALEGQNALCVLTLDTFCGLLGSVCGDFLLANGAYGGLYLAGGIIPRMIPFLRASDFARRLRDKGAMHDHLSTVPLYAITTAQPGLIGAAHAPA